MTIKIGDKTFATKKPADLDAKLITSTGLNVGEVGGLLKGNPQAHHVARALHPFLTGDDVPNVPELANAIATHGVLDAAAQVSTLYKGDAAPEAKA
jgi:hypothetical protein